MPLCLGAGIIEILLLNVFITATENYNFMRWYYVPDSMTLPFEVYNLPDVFFFLGFFAHPLTVLIKWDRQPYMERLI